MLLALMTFLAVTASLVGGYLVVTEFLHPDANRVRRRLASEFAKDQPQASPSALYKKLDQLKLDPGQALPDLLAPEQAAAPAAPKIGLRQRLDNMLEQANVPLTVQHLLILSVALAFAQGAVATWFGGLLAGLAAVALGGAAPVLYVRWRHKVRQENYLRQLPGAFDLMARVIRAGQSVPQALQAVADAFEDPLASEFANCQKQQNLGLRPEVCFQELMERAGIVEMRIFAMAMVIQRQSGGNLSDVLERLGSLVRSRLRLRAHVRTLTAEGRMQGWTLVVLPFLVLGAMLAINRTYAEVLFDHVPLLLAGLAAMGVGILWIRRIVNFDS